MKNRHFGVWFSLALAIFLLSVWPGSKLGEKLAAYRYHSAQRRGLGNLSASEHAHLESVLDELDVIGFLRLSILASANNDKLKKVLPEEVGKIEDFRRKVKASETKHVADLDLALADVVMALDEEQDNNKDMAKTHMRSAQSILQSLGWREY